MELNYYMRSVKLSYLESLSLVRGVEVHDVEAGVSMVEERGEEEPPAKRVRREQDARARGQRLSDGKPLLHAP